MELEKEIIYFSFTLPFLIFIIFLIVMSNAMLIQKLINKTNFYQTPKSMIYIALALADEMVFFFPFIHASFNEESNENGTCRFTNYYTFYFLPLFHGICIVTLGYELLLRQRIIEISNDYLRCIISLFMGSLPWICAILMYLHFVMPSQDFTIKESKSDVYKITTICVFMPTTLAFITMSIVIVLQCLNKKRRHAIDNDSLDRLVSGSPTSQTQYRHDLSTILSTFACASAAFVVLSLVSAVENFRNFVERRGQEQYLIGLCLFLTPLTSFAASVVSFLALHLMLKQKDQTICSELTCFEDQDSQPNQADEKHNQISTLEENTKQNSAHFFKSDKPLQDTDSTRRIALSSTSHSEGQQSKYDYHMWANEYKTHKQRKPDIYKGMEKLYVMICVYIVMSIPRHIFSLYETMDHNSVMLTLIDDGLMLLFMSRSFVTPILLLF